jgi:hypothetical protein
MTELEFKEIFSEFGINTPPDCYIIRSMKISLGPCLRYIKFWRDPARGKIRIWHEKYNYNIFVECKLDEVIDELPEELAHRLVYHLDSLHK